MLFPSRKAGPVAPISWVLGEQHPPRHPASNFSQKDSLPAGRSDKDSMPKVADEEATFLKGPHPKTAKDLTSNLPRVMPKADVCLSETPKAVTEKA